MECILRMCLGLLALQRLEAAAGEAVEGGSSSQAGTVIGSAQITHADGRLEAPPSGQTADAAPAGGKIGQTAGGQAAAAAAGSDADEHAGDDTASGSSGAQPPPPPLPPLRHADFALLQCHPVSGSERDAQQWRRATAFLLAALQDSGWPEPLPSQVRRPLLMVKLDLEHRQCGGSDALRPSQKQPVGGLTDPVVGVPLAAD